MSPFPDDAPATNSSTLAAWNSLLASEFHCTYGRKKQLQGLSHSLPHTNSQDATPICSEGPGTLQTQPALFATHLQDIFDALHLVYEQSKLSVLSVLHLRPLAKLLLALAQLWSAQNFIDYYQRDFGPIASLSLVK